MSAEELRVATVEDRLLVQAMARRVALAHGFSAEAAAAVATAASELASNAVKFAGAGLVRVRGDEAGVEVEVTDEGPGFADPALAVVDGYSEGEIPVEPRHHRRGLGVGLGGVARLMDELVLENRPGGGARVVARKRRG